MEYPIDHLYEISRCAYCKRMMTEYPADDERCPVNLMRNCAPDIPLKRGYLMKRVTEILSELRQIRDAQALTPDLRFAFNEVCDRLAVLDSKLNREKIHVDLSMIASDIFRDAERHGPISQAIVQIIDDAIGRGGMRNIRSIR